MHPARWCCGRKGLCPTSISTMHAGPMAGRAVPNKHLATMHGWIGLWPNKHLPPCMQAQWLVGLCPTSIWLPCMDGLGCGPSHARTRAHAHARTRAHAHARTCTRAHARAHMHTRARTHVHAHARIVYESQSAGGCHSLRSQHPPPSFTSLRIGLFVTRKDWDSPKPSRRMRKVWVNPNLYVESQTTLPAASPW
jgi:hypothetical protein